MALSLPNNPVFVPLDVLTADELNQIVANVNRIAEQFPLSSSNIASSAITSDKIASSAVTSTKLSVTSGKVITLGSTKIAWGSQTFSIASGVDGAFTVTLPTTFSTMPTITATVAMWIANPYIMVNDITTRNFLVVIRHSQGSVQNVPMNYIAIG